MGLREKIGRISVGVVADQDTKLKFPDRGHYNYECLENQIADKILALIEEEKQGWHQKYIEMVGRWCREDSNKNNGI